MQYIEIFFSGNDRNISLEIFDIFSYFCSKHGIRIHVRTALEQKYEKIGYPVYPSLTK